MYLNNMCCSAKDMPLLNSFDLAKSEPWKELQPPSKTESVKPL